MRRDFMINRFKNINNDYGEKRFYDKQVKKILIMIMNSLIVMINRLKNISKIIAVRRDFMINRLKKC